MVRRGGATRRRAYNYNMDQYGINLRSWDIFNVNIWDFYGFPVGNVRSLNICSDPMALGVPHHSVEA